MAGAPKTGNWVDFEAIRDGTRALLGQSIRNMQCVQEIAGTIDCDALASAFEQAIFREVTAKGAPVRMGKQALRDDYAKLRHKVSAALGRQLGQFPDDVLILMSISGRVTVDQAVKISAELADGETEEDPRELIRRLFIRLLLKGSVHFAQNRSLAADTAHAIEISCYNQTIKLSKESEEPPRRLWTSSSFTDIYSTRCGIIAGLLDPSSTSCRAYGPTLVMRLLAGLGITAVEDGMTPLRPEDLGRLGSKELCPKSIREEAAEIERRVNQKVVEKESRLFSCPYCNERRCTYTEVQRRSLDEAPDYLCLCLCCRRRFTGKH